MVKPQFEVGKESRRRRVEWSVTRSCGPTRCSAVAHRAAELRLAHRRCHRQSAAGPVRQRRVLPAAAGDARDRPLVGDVLADAVARAVAEGPQ